MRQRTNITAVLLALCLLLTACGGKEGGGEPAQPAAPAAYTSDIVPLDLASEITASGAGNGFLYLAVCEEDEIAPEDEEGEFTSSFSFSSNTNDDGGFTFYSGSAGRASLYRMDAATGETVKLEGYTSNDGVTIAAIVPCADGSLWVLEQTGSMDSLDLGDIEGLAAVAGLTGFDTGGNKVWRKLDASGSQELNAVDTSDLAEKLGVDAVTDTRMDREDRLYAVSGSTVTVLDAALSPLFTCKVPEAVERLISLGDGRVAAVTAGEAGRTVYPIGTDGQGLGDACPLSGSADRIFTGNDAYDFYYNSGDSLYGWSTETARPEKILSWSGAGVDMGQITALALLPDGLGATVTRDRAYWPVSYSLALLAPAGEEALSGRTLLTLATLGLDSETRARVLEFNRTSGSCRIEIRDYSEYNAPGDASAGLNKLNTEILAGNMPDLLDVTSVPLRRYASKGLLEDLWPYVESDSALGREGVMERVLEADEIGGKLYRVFPRFTIDTAVGSPSVVGDRAGWTLEELKSVLDRQDTGCTLLGSNETKDSILEAMFAGNLDRFVDWEAGKASFDSPQFQAILEFCNTFPAQARSQEEASPYTWAARGEQMLLPVSLGDLTSIQIYRALFGGEAVFVGYPSQGGSAVAFGVEGGMAMSSSCRDKDGAWSFLRQALLAEGDMFTYGFPVNRANFEKAAQDSMKITYVKDENGDPIIGPDGEPMTEGSAIVVLDTQAVMLKPASQEDYRQVMALYEAAEGISGRDENIWSIVRECAGACFSGDRTAEETAGTIQNRVELYLNEQK